jgi:hypothetical protein
MHEVLFCLIMRAWQGCKPYSLPGSNREILGVKELPLAPQGVVRCLRKRSLNETPRKCYPKWLKVSPDVSDCHLNKHCLINSLGVLVAETRLGHERSHMGLPPKISPKLPVSGMKTMNGYTALASYTKFYERFYHQADTQHQGPSVSSQAFYRGARPAPLIECYAPKDTLRLITERQQQVQSGQVEAPSPLEHPTRDLLACRRCGKVVGCTCGMPPLGSTLEKIVTLQKERGRR